MHRHKPAVALLVLVDVAWQVVGTTDKASFIRAEVLQVAHIEVVHISVIDEHIRAVRQFLVYILLPLAK